MAKMYQVRTFNFFSLRITNKFFVTALTFSLNNINNNNNNNDNYWCYPGKFWMMIINLLMLGGREGGREGEG